jgi:hypothetical protein
MPACIELTKEMLTSPVRLTINDKDLSFSVAKEIADRKALEINPDTMLLAWFDRKSGGFSPRVGGIVIDINDEEYVFVYLG